MPVSTHNESEAATAAAARSGSPRRVSGWDIAFGGAALAAVAVLLYLGRDTTFWGDDWNFINARLGWDIDAFMQPHWEHWMLGVAILWKPLLATIGLQSYLPYLLVLVVLHVITAAAVYRMVRRQAGYAIAFAAVVVFLFLGSAGEVLLYALPANLVGSTAAGAWALALFLEQPTRRGQWLIAALLIVSIATSGPALFFIAAIGAVTLIVPGRRRELWVVVPALLAYGAWLLTYGRSSLGGGHSWLLSASLLPDYIRDGIAHAVGSFSGLGDEIGLILAVILILATVWHLFGRRPILEGAVAGVAGLIAQFGLTGLVRAQKDVAAGLSQAEASRYVYMAAVFLLVAGSAWLSRRPPIVLREARTILPLLAVTGFALAANLVALGSWHSFFVDRADEVRAAIGILTRYGGSPAIAGDRPASVAADSWLRTLPSPDRLREIVSAYGSPVDDILVPGTPVVPADVYERVLLDYVAEAFVVTRADAMPDGLVPPVVRQATDLMVQPENGCLRLAPTGVDPWVVVEVPTGQVLFATSSEPGTVEFRLSSGGVFSERATRVVEVTAGEPLSVTTPDLADSVVWLLRVDVPAAGQVQMCSHGPAK